MRYRLISMGFLLAAALTLNAAPDGYTLVKTIPVAGAGGWDYLVVDEAGRRLYISHGDQVDAIDVDSGKVMGTIPDTKGVHGIAIAADLNRGFSSNGGASSVTIFDLKTLKRIEDVKVGKNPDCIIYDRATKQVFAFNGGENSASVIDAARGKVLGKISLGGRPEYAVADGAGHVYVNLVDKHALVKIDAKNMKVLEKWSIDPGQNPSSLTMDPKTDRLFLGCRNKRLVVVDAKGGKVVAQIPIGSQVDANVFDPATSMIYASCGDGTVSVIHEESPEKFTLVEIIKTKVGSKTMALDPKSHKIYLPSADFKQEPGNTRPTIVPNSFAVLEFGK